MSKKALMKAMKAKRVHATPIYKHGHMGNLTRIIYDIYGPENLKR